MKIKRLQSNPIVPFNTTQTQSLADLQNGQYPANIDGLFLFLLKIDQSSEKNRRKHAKEISPELQW